MKRLLWLVSSLSIVACGDPPTATFVFAPFRDLDACEATEAEVAEATRSIWVGLRQDGVVVEASCVDVTSADGWTDIEDALVDAGALAEDLPLGVPLRPFVMGLPVGAPCSSAIPGGGIVFCARTSDDVVIDEDDGGGTVELERICRTSSNAQGCFGE